MKWRRESAGVLKGLSLRLGFLVRFRFQFGSESRLRKRRLGKVTVAAEKVKSRNASRSAGRQSTETRTYLRSGGVSV